MDLQEQVTALTAEKNQYLNLLQMANAEKIALDQQLVETLKQLIENRKNLLLSNNQIKELDAKLQESISKEDFLKNEICELKLSLESAT